jgi:hypothetical protein
MSESNAWIDGPQFDAYRRDRDQRRAETIHKAAERVRGGRFLSPQVHTEMKQAATEAGRRFDEREPVPASIDEWRAISREGRKMATDPTVPPRRKR